MKQKFYLLFALLLTAGMASSQAVNEDFENGFPADWTKSTDFWMHGTAASLSSAYFPIPEHSQFMCVNDDLAGNGVSSSGNIGTFAVDLTGLTDGAIIFDAYFVDGDYQGADERALVQVSKDDGATWTEELSLPGSGGWAKHLVSLADYAGETILVAFDYDDGDGWNFGYCVDNVYVGNYDVKSDAELLGITTECTAAVPGVLSMYSGTLFNYAAASNITSFDVQIEGSELDATTVSVSDVDIAPFTSLTFDIPYEYEVGDANDVLTFTVMNLSTGDDEDMTNNASDIDVESVDAKEGNAAVVEEATGTWCTWCPRGAVYMERAAHCFEDNFVGIAVHNNDPMVNTAYDAGLTSHPGFSGFPSVIFDRNNILNPDAIFAPIAAKIVQEPMVSITSSVVWDSINRTIDVEATATFVNAIVDGYRFNAIIVEDGVTGTGSDYNQINAYSGGGNGPMGGYEDLPNPVPASQMVYDQVGRALLGGYAGVAGSIGAIAAGESATYAFGTYTLPAAYDYNNVRVAVMVYEPSGRIMNGGLFDLGTESSNTFFVAENEVNWSVSPNPFRDQAVVTVDLPESGDIQLTMVDMLGKVVYAQKYDNQFGVNNYTISRSSMPAGVYTVLLTYKGQNAVQKVVVD